MMPYSVSVPITRRVVMATRLRGGARLRCVSAPEPAEEQVAIIDDAGVVIGSAPRSVMRRDNLRHIVVAVLVRDPAGRIYVHRRTDTKDVFPGRHDCFAAGCLQAGEEIEAAARREVAEELGVVGAVLSPLFVMRYDDVATRHVCHAFVVTHHGPITHQADEVAWGAWMTPDELRARLADPTWPFVPDGRALIERWFTDPAIRK
jgi:8-oxo-dGTP pyrophosphatase MutT (NUDIX family)